MKVVSRKQIKFNRGQVSDLLSERVDMGLQNACGTVYDNMYINRYGQLQNSPIPFLCCEKAMNISDRIICMFDSGTDFVYPITVTNPYGTTGVTIKVFGPISKTSPNSDLLSNQTVDFSNPIQSQTVEEFYVQRGAKVLQFGYNVLIYGQEQKPFLFTLTPQGSSWNTYVTLTVKDSYFDDAFNQIYVRGNNIGAPTGFTPPTTGYYNIADHSQVVNSNTTVTVTREGTGSAFTQDLVGQVIDCPGYSGALQVRSVESADSLTAYVLSPLVNTNNNVTFFHISFAQGRTKWIFGYEKPYGATLGPNNTPSYPDSAIYVNQRLIFGGNDYHGNLISVSRIGVINDFDPESATESDAFTTQIASKDFCRIVDFVVSNNELRIACTNGEYAMALSNLTPSGSLNGFDLRSEVGIKKGTAICDCGGLTAYTSLDGGSVYGTQFSLLRDRYQPISLTSQTENMIINCNQLKYLTNRANNEGNCLLGKNSDNSLFVGEIDLNAGLIGLTKITKFGTSEHPVMGRNIHVTNLFVVGGAAWAEIAFNYSATYMSYYNRYLVRFTFGEMFAFPVWFRYYAPGQVIPGTEHHPNELVLPSLFGVMAQANHSDMKFRVLYYNGSTKSYEIITPTGYTYNADGTYTVNFANDIVQSNIVVAGFVRQSDWRSVEISVGMATRELNKRIVKLEGVIEPTQITGRGRFAGLTLTPEQAKNFITLTRSKDVEQMDVDNLANTSYTEDQDVVWRRAFDNPDRKLHFGVSMVAPFLIKSITATIEYDEVA